MALFNYRAILADGSTDSGQIEAGDIAQALAGIRRLGAAPVVVAPAAEAASDDARATKKGRAAAAVLIGELAVLLKAGLPLDRALALALQNIEPPGTAAEFGPLLIDVKEGMPLSRAMSRRPGLFSPAAVAMTEAGEANGRLGDALSRLSDMLEQAAALRRLISTSMIYPIALTIIAVGVILLMLLFVVPQFEALFATAKDKLPASTQIVMGASRLVRDNGFWMLGVLALAGLSARRLAGRPTIRAALDRNILAVPQIGPLIQRTETARFARTLGALIEGEVPLPNAFALAQRTIGNRHMAQAVQKVGDGIKEGGGLTAPIAAARIFPQLAIGFLRTGEESSQMGLMLNRLADVLDRDVRVRLERLIGILTPSITVILGVAVAAIIASIMSAILGFNELAVS